MSTVLEYGAFVDTPSGLYYKQRKSLVYGLKYKQKLTNFALFNETIFKMPFFNRVKLFYAWYQVPKKDSLEFFFFFGINTI